MGKSTKLISTGQGEDHAAGASVFLLQTLVHDPLGAIGYSPPDLWPCHVAYARAAYKRLSAIQDEIGELAVDPKRNARHIDDGELLVEVYDAGSSMVSNVVRSVRHLAWTMAAERGSPLTTSTAIENIREATNAVEIDCRIGHPGYYGFGEIVRIRDAIEHPRASNVYQGDDSSWDQVPLAWLLSDRSLKAFEGFAGWFDPIVADWNAWLARRPKRPQTWTVRRGMKSRHPAKKPKPA